MDLCFLVPGVPADGDAAAEHARRLGDRHAVTVAVCAASVVGGGALPLKSLRDALAQNYDAVVAFEWTTTVQLFSFQTARHVYHVDGFAHEQLDGDPQRFPAQLSYDLPVDFIAAAPWVARALDEQRPDARCVTVARGVQRASEPARPEAVVVIDRDPLPDILSGRVVVASSALPGVEDMIEHGVNGFLVEPDDDRGAQRFLDLLAGDADQLARMAVAARATAWPDPDQSAAAFEQALEQFVAEPMPDAARWPDRLMADAMAAADALRAQLAARDRRLSDLEGTAAYRATQRLRSMVRRGS